MKKVSNIFFAAFVILFVLFLIYSYRNVFFSTYDNSYLRDLYDHSQWSIPISKRTVGDNIVYKVTGYDLVKNWNYFSIDPQTPVLGKYIFGYSILIFKNAEIASLIIYLFTAFIFYKLSRIILKNDSLSKIALLIFITEPIIFYQSSQSMLDLPQLFFLIIHIISIVNLTNSKKIQSSLFWLILSGFSLGGFISLKIGFFSIAIILGDLIYLFKKKKLTDLAFILLISGLTYITSYLPYFFQGHSFIDFAKAQKWIIFSYWLQSETKPAIGMVFLSLLAGFYKGFTQKSTWERVREWTILWPMYVYLLVKSHLIRINDEILYLSVIIINFIILYALTPFSPRYLTLIIPLLIIFAVKYLTKINKIIMAVILVIYVLQIVLFLRPSPHDSLASINRVWKVGAYQDLYDFLDMKTQENISRYDFWRNGQLFEKDLGVINRDLTINVPDTYFWQSEKIGALEIKYQTRLGELTNLQKFKIIRQNNEWKIKWSDHYLLSDYAFKDKIIASYIDGNYGKLISDDGVIMSEATMWPVFYLTPEIIIDESRVIEQLKELTGIEKHNMEYLYKANWQWDWPAEIGPLKSNLSPEILQNYNLDKSISIKYRPIRINNNYLTKYPQLDPVLGGMITLEKMDGTKKTIIKRDKVDGQDFVYEKSN